MNAWLDKMSEKSLLILWRVMAQTCTDPKTKDFMDNVYALEVKGNTIAFSINYCSADSLPRADEVLSYLKAHAVYGNLFTEIEKLRIR